MPSSNPSTRDPWQFGALKKTICNGLIAVSARGTYDVQIYASKGFMGTEFRYEMTLVDDGPALKAMVSADYDVLDAVVASGTDGSCDGFYVLAS
jgi:hypothetical protein